MSRPLQPNNERRDVLLSVAVFWLLIVSAVIVLTGCGGGDPEDEPAADPIDCKALRAIAPPPGKTLELPAECLE